jgi:parvulin-like peptidyl-prolyl isomerase
MAKTKAAKVISKKHLARMERERRQTMLITFIAIAIVVAVVGMIGYGILDQTVLQATKPVVRVGEDVVTTREFQMRVRLARQQYINQYIQYYQYALMFGMDPTSDPTISQYLSQIQTTLDNSDQMGSDTLDQLVDELLIRQYTQQNKIVVSAEEIDQTIQSDFNFFPDGTPTPTITPTAIVYPTLSATQLALVTITPTPSPFPTFTPSPTPTPDLSATPTTVPTITPTATPYTLEGFQSDYKTAADSYTKLGLSEADIRKVFFEDRLYRQKVYEIITKDVPHEQDQVWARHILVADEATAQSVLNQLLNGGDWVTLAAKYSTDTGSKDIGGDVGWFSPGKMVAEFENAAFKLPVGAISQPIQTTFGWHIIQVLGHENRPLTDADYKQATDAKFQEWLTEARNATTVKIYDDYLTKVPTDPTLSDALAAIQQ